MATERIPVRRGRRGLTPWLERRTLRWAAKRDNAAPRAGGGRVQRRPTATVITPENAGPADE